jgi:hypothetical protein
MPAELSPALRDALNVYADLERQAITLGKRTDPDRKIHLVRLRRQLAEQIGVVGLAIARDSALARTPDLQQEMNRLFTTFRYALGQHQANWPAVKIDEDREGYARSAQATYAKSDLFWAWCQSNLGLRRAAA